MLIRQEYGDELYAANSHNTSEEQDPPSAFPTTLAENTDHGDHHGLEATGATAQYPFAAAENENGVEGDLDSHGENNTVKPSSAAEAAATEEECDADDEIDEGIVGQQEEQQQQLQRGEESDELYDIDDLGLSSSDDG